MTPATKTVSADKKARTASDAWRMATLGEVCEINPRKPKDINNDLDVTFVPMPAIDEVSGAITTPQIRNYAEVRKGYTYFQEGDVLMAKITPCMENGKAAIAKNLNNGIGFGSTEFHILRPKEGILAEYVYHYIRQKSFRKAAEANMTGSVGQKRVPADWLRSQAIPVPPIEVQQEIVKRIGITLPSIRAAREGVERARETLKKFRKAILQAAYSGQLTANWREKNKDDAENFLLKLLDERAKNWDAEQSAKGRKRKCPKPISYEDKELADLPDSWLWTSADTICSQITDGEHIQPRYQKQGLPMLTAKHVREGFVVFDDVGLIAEKDFAKCLDRCAPRKNDVLIVSVGATTGRAAIVETSKPFAIVRSVLLVRPLTDPHYFLYWCQSLWCLRWMQGASGASAQPHLYIKDTKRMPVPLAPLAEQKEIVAQIKKHFEIADRVEERLEKIDAVCEKSTSAILSKMFITQ